MWIILVNNIHGTVCLCKDFCVSEITLMCLSHLEQNVGIPWADVSMGHVTLLQQLTCWFPATTHSQVRQSWPPSMIFPCPLHMAWHFCSSGPIARCVYHLHKMLISSWTQIMMCQVGFRPASCWSGVCILFETWVDRFRPASCWSGACILFVKWPARFRPVLI